MKITTFNVNSIRSRLPSLLDWLGRYDPDIVCLQETKVQDEEFPVGPFFERGYHLVFHGQKQYNGVAIVSRHPIEEAQIGLPGDPEPEARFIKARIGPFIIVNTYVPQGQSRDSEKFRYKLDWFDRLESFFRETLSAEDRVVWMGDLNVAREKIDVYDPDRLWGHVCFCAEVQQAFENVLRTGFEDVFRMFHPEPEQYTFWDYQAARALERNRGWRLDYILADPVTAAACRSCWIDVEARRETKPSDHTYVTAEFDVESLAT